MDVLVIGGSVFLGRAMVAQALTAGATVTVFNRGSSAPAPVGVEQVIGDRSDPEDLAQLAGRHFDLVIDTCGYVPAIVALSAQMLAPACGHYVFISSINAYPGWPEDSDYRVRGVHDGSPDATQAPADLDAAGPYGWLKVGCERTVARAFGDERTTVLRAGLIVGPHDSAVGRLPWWISRVAAGGEVLVPGSPTDTISFIDSRDLARFALLAVPGPARARHPRRPDGRLQRGHHPRRQHRRPPKHHQRLKHRHLHLCRGQLAGRAGRRGMDGGAPLGPGYRGPLGLRVPCRAGRCGWAVVAPAHRHRRRHLGVAAGRPRRVAPQRADAWALRRA